MRGGFCVALGTDALADLLLTHYVGLRILSRSGASVQQLRDSASALQALKP